MTMGPTALSAIALLKLLLAGVVSTLLVMKGLLVVSIGVGVTGALLAWRERSEPGAVPLVALLVGQCWWSASLFFQLNAAALAEKTLWVDLSWVGVVIIPVAWLFFSLEYTGYHQYVRARYLALAAVVPAITVALSLTSGHHELLYADTALVDRSGTAMIDRTPGVWYWAAAAYTYVLGLLGAIPMLGFLSSDNNTFRSQTVALLLGLLGPWVTNALHLAGVLPTAGIDPTPIAFCVSGIAYLGALTRFRLFDTSPAPIQPARRSIFERMEEGVVVIDRYDNVVDVNPKAAEMLADDPERMLGRPIDSVFPEMAGALDESRTGRSTFEPEAGSRTYDVAVTELTDVHDRRTGRLVTFHDITDHVRHQQRLEVMNRVFRHNVRSNLQIIVGNAERLRDVDREIATDVKRNALQIEEYSDAVRTALDIFQRDHEQPRTVRLDSLVRECVERIRDEYPSVDARVDLDSADVYVDSVLEQAYRNVIENAAQHNTNPEPTVWIESTVEDGRVTVTVTDNGPGIDDDELVLLDEGTESPLEHGSGFGLALAIWGTESADGQITFEENDPTGLTVAVEAPILAGDPAAEDRREPEPAAESVPNLQG